jgi:hypothetical protein
LHNTHGYSDVVEKAEPHALIRLSMMSRWAHVSESLFQLAACDGKTRFNDAAAAYASGKWRGRADVERFVLEELD